MNWPWSRPETRSSNYGDQVLLAAVSAAEGAAHVGDTRHTAALEAVCRLYQSVFGVAKVASSNPAVTQAVSSTWLSSVVRAMIRNGEYVCEVVEDGGRLVFLPASQVDVQGGPRPSSWVYTATMDGPSGSLTRTVPASEVLHLKWSVDPSRPWSGVSPMMASSLTNRLCGSLEARQSEEAAAPVGAILPMAKGPQDPDDDDDPLTQLRADLRQIGGRTILTETQMATGDRATSPMADFAMRRLGGNIPASMTNLRNDVGMDVARSAGVPLSLVEALATGTGAREGWRRFTQSACSAAANILVDEISSKLGVTVKFDLSPAYGSDLVGRSSAVQKLVAAGVDVKDARAIAGV